MEILQNPHHSDFEIIEIRSNLSISLDRLMAIFLGLSTVTLLVALGPLILGLWPILIIALFHLLMVGWCLRLAWRGHWARERLLIGPEVLGVEHFEQGGRSRSEWPLAWVRVQILPDRSGESRVYLVCQGKRQQLGAFLPMSERMEFARTLKHCLQPLSAWTHENQPRVS